MVELAQWDWNEMQVLKFDLFQVCENESLDHNICIWSLIRKYDHVFYDHIEYVFLLNLVFDIRIW